jgi:2-polyprenyl-6-methoxyphenol hydroxylase-like FAD-dependent oxidoreductase
MGNSPPRIKLAIVGGGPAGLVAALTANRCGIETVVFEQAESFRRIGGGILLHSNGLRVLHALGVLDGFEPRLLTTQKLLLLLADGQLVGEVDYSTIAVPQNRCGVVLRHVLHEYLMEAAQTRGVDIRFSHRLETLSFRDREVELGFGNGYACRADLVLACDGIHSATRSAAGIAGKKIPIGEAYLRTVSDVPVATSVIREIWGNDGRRFGICPLREHRTYIFCSVPLGVWDDIRNNRLAEWIESWSPFGSEVTSLKRAVPDWNAPPVTTNCTQ